MKTKATLTLNLAGSRVRESLQSVLAPDNEGAPRGMELKMHGSGVSLVFSAESDSAAASISAALAVLRDVSLFQEVWLLSQGKGATVHRVDSN